MGEQFYSLGPCSNCKSDFWSRDYLFEKRSKGRLRYACVYCGDDYIPGAALNDRQAGRSPANQTEAADEVSEYEE